MVECGKKWALNMIARWKEANERAPEDLTYFLSWPRERKKSMNHVTGVM